jgi:transcriptional regulator with XRE-family HTH domain
MADLSRSKMVDVKTLGDRLKSERLAAGLTQQQLAEEAGVSKQAVSAIETGGTKDPSAATLDPICRRLGLRQAWLISGRGSKTTGVAEERGEYNASQHLGFDLEKILDAQRLLRQLHQITRDPADSEDNIASLTIAYQVVDAESREPHRADTVDLVQRLAEKLRADREKVDGDKRREAEGTGGKDGRGNARRAR